MKGNAVWIGGLSTTPHLSDCSCSIPATSYHEALAWCAAAGGCGWGAHLAVVPFVSQEQQNCTVFYLKLVCALLGTPCKSVVFNSLWKKAVQEEQSWVKGFSLSQVSLRYDSALKGALTLWREGAVKCWTTVSSRGAEKLAFWKCSSNKSKTWFKKTNTRTKPPLKIPIWQLLSTPGIQVWDPLCCACYRDFLSVAVHGNRPVLFVLMGACPVSCK